MSTRAGAPILVLEDEPSTRTLIVQLLAGARISNPIESLASGAEAVEFLDRATETGVLPVLCVLDLSLPDVTGLEVLRHIRTTAVLASLPVIMLTGSSDDEDIEAAYALGIEAYLIKPAGVHGLPDVVREINLSYELRPPQPGGAD